MATEVQAGEYFTVTFPGFDPGLLGTITAGLYDDLGNVISAQVATGITEVPPATGTYSVERLAPTVHGSYVLKVLDGSGGEGVEDIDVVGLSGIFSYAPSVQQVATLIRARTKDDSDNEIGTFNANTRPTAQQVEDTILLIIGNLTGCVGDWLPTWLHVKSQAAIAYGAAATIELSFWPEQIANDDSPYKELRKLFLEEQKELCFIAETYRPDDLPSPTTGIQLNPTFFFGDGNEDPMGQRQPAYKSIEWDPATERWFFRGEGEIIYLGLI